MCTKTKKEACDSHVIIFCLLKKKEETSLRGKGSIVARLCKSGFLAIFINRGERKVILDANTFLPDKKKFEYFLLLILKILRNSSAQIHLENLIYKIYII